MQESAKIEPVENQAMLKASPVFAHALSSPHFQMTPAQLRAARSLLDWTRIDLARASGLSPETIRNIEHGNFRPQEQTLRNLFETLSNYGVEFFSTSSQNVVGVALVSPKEAKAV
jgi:predicted transcriptional regulator